MRHLRSRARFLVLLILLAGAAGAAFAQEVSRKKDIAVFALSYYDVKIAPKYLGSIDAAIQQVFVNIGRFNVLGMTYRLGRGDVSAFIEKIKQLKEENMKIPEKVQMGQEFFTEADLNRIIGSFIVVIPSVTSFVVEGGSGKTTTTTTSSTSAGVSSVKSKSTASVAVKSKTVTTTKEEKGAYHAVIQTSFSFVNIEQMRAIAQVTVKSEGWDDNRDTAIQEAIDRIPDRLTYEIRKIEEFKLKTGVLEVQGRTVILELGRDMGIKPGDEFSIIGSRVLASGKMLTRPTGLLIIKEVSDEVSIGRVIYATTPVQEGDQLKEFPLFGVEAQPYVHLAVGSAMGGGMVLLAGVRTTMTRGFYTFKPLAGVELPLALEGTVVASGGLPVNIYAGGEMDLYMGRLQFNPMAAVGIGGSVPLSGEDFYLSHVGLKAGASVTFLFSDKMKLSVEGGFNYWFAVSDLAADYFGPTVGAGLVIKL